MKILNNYFVSLSIILFVFFSINTLSKEKVSAPNKKPSFTINLSKLHIKVKKKYNCKVKVSAIITYKPVPQKIKPQLVHYISCGGKASLGITPLKSYKRINAHTIKISREVPLAATARCKGACSVTIWVSDQKVNSNKIEKKVIF